MTTTTNTPNAATLALFQSIIAKQKADSETKFSEYEKDFLDNTSARYEHFGEETFFTDKQSGMVERMHKEHVQGIKRKRKSTSTAK